MAICQLCIEDDYTFEDNCNPVPGGNFKNISIIPSCYILSYTQDLNGVITAITLDLVNNPTAQWYTVACRRDTVVVTETAQFPSNAVLQEIAFNISNFYNDADLDTAAQLQANFLNSLLTSSDGFIAVVRDRAGARRLYGFTNPLFVTNLVKASGTVLTDIAGTDITLAEAQPRTAFAIDSAVVGTGLIPA
jgi:hypothetical protein